MSGYFHTAVLVGVVACSAGLLLPSRSSADGSVLVASRVIEPTAYDVTLPEKVGLFEAGEHRELAFEVTGRLEVLTLEGEPLARGETLAELDTRLERAAVRQAELRLREARSELARVRGLYGRSATSQKALEAAETAAALRGSELVTAQAQLERRRLIAPFDGVVAETRYDEGEVVRPGDTVATFIALDELRLDVGVPAYQIGKVARGARVVVDVPALDGERTKGTVVRVAPAAREGQHLFPVEIRVPNSEGRLRPGMGARARIVVESLPSVIVVPLSALVQRDSERLVFFVDGDQARAVRATEAMVHGDRLILPGDLPFRELVVRGQRDLQDGSRVRVDNTILTGAPESSGSAAQRGGVSPPPTGQAPRTASR